jgi:outer membrane protein assembly factor BamB
MEQKRIKNPYIVGPPVTGEVSFYGREDIFQFVNNVLDSANERVIVLYGQRRIGKTSVLHQLTRNLSPKFHTVFFDLMGHARDSLPKVLFSLATIIAKSLEILPPKSAEFENAENYFQDVFLPKAYEELGEKRLLLLFDEFDVLGDEPLTGTAAIETLFLYFRQLIADESRLAFVFVVGRRIEELTMEYQSIFKQAQYKRISLLERDEAVRLVTEPVKGVIGYDPDAVDALLDLTACHPYLTQLMCSEVFNYVRRDKKTHVSVEDVNAVVGSAIETGTGGLTWFWEGVPRAERFILAALAQVCDEKGVASMEDIRKALQSHRIRLIGQELTEAPRRLEEWEMLSEEGHDCYRFNIELVRRWIAEQHPLEKARREIDFISTRATRAFADARDAHLAGDLEMAIEDYRRALAANPNHSSAQLGLAQALYEKGNFDEAIIEYEKDFQLGEALALDGLVKALLGYGEQLEKAGNVGEALKKYERALELAPYDEEVKSRINGIKELSSLFEEAMLAHIAGKWSEAEMRWSKLYFKNRNYTWNGVKAARLFAHAIVKQEESTSFPLWQMVGHDPQHTGRSQYIGPESNSLHWILKTNSSIHSSPAVGVDGTVYVGSWDIKDNTDNNLYAVDPNGKQKWKFETKGGVYSPAIGADGVIYVGSEDNNLYAVDPDGKQKWKFETKGRIPPPAIGADGTIYVGSEDNNLYAVDPDRKQKWKFETKGRVSSPAIGADGTIYVGSWDNNLYAVDPDGKQKWKFETKENVSSPSIGADGTIIVGSKDNNLYAVDPGGKLKWKFETKGEVFSSPAIGADGIIYVGSLDNNLYAVNPDGKLKWKFETKGEVRSSPAIGAGGTIYVGSFDGNLYAIGAIF